MEYSFHKKGSGLEKPWLHDTYKEKTLHNLPEHQIPAPVVVKTPPCEERQGILKILFSNNKEKHDLTNPRKKKLTQTPTIS